MRYFTGVSLANIVSLVQAIAWPSAIVVLFFIYRREIPGLIRALGGRISKFSAVGLTLELSAAQMVPATVRVQLEDIREPASGGQTPPSGKQSLIELARSTAPVDYIRIDLREGGSWLTSRLYLFAVVLPPILRLRCFVFVCSHGELPRYFLGLSSPEAVRTALETRYPWLRNAMVEAQLVSLFYGQGPTRSPAWYPNPEIQKALKDLSAASAGPTFESKTQYLDALEQIMQSLLSPFDLSQSGQGEIFIQRFLQTRSVRRPHRHTSPEVLDADWISLGDVDEHAHWIVNERQLLDFLGDDLKRQCVVVDGLVSKGGDKDDLTKAVMSKQGDFVAVIDPEGRFKRLIDRAALIHKIAHEG
jgi:hypothetical protein